MSQYGAYRMAEEGLTAAEILSHYYTGATVTTAPTPQEVAVQVLKQERLGQELRADEQALVQDHEVAVELRAPRGSVDAEAVNSAQGQ